MKSGKKIEFAPYCYLVPSMLIFAVFLFYPFFKTIYLSLFMTNKMGQAKLFVGLQNYIDLLSSKSFQNSLFCFDCCSWWNVTRISSCGVV